VCDLPFSNLYFAKQMHRYEYLFSLLSEKSILDCPSNCKTCSDASTCLTCKSGYALQDSQCVPCGSGTFLDGTTCTSKFKVSERLLKLFLKDCPDECATCSSATYCLSCSSGYTLNSTMSCIEIVSASDREKETYKILLGVSVLEVTIITFLLIEIVRRWRNFR